MLHLRPVVLGLLLGLCSVRLSLGAGAVVIDHTCTDLSKIPSDWIVQAKSVLRIGYQHTSHGSQLVTGLQVISNTVGGVYRYTASSSGLRTRRKLASESTQS